MTRLNDKYFYSDGDCRDHHTYKCEECLDKSTSLISTSIVALGYDVRLGENARDNAMEQFSKQKDFIQEALNLTDKGMAAKKVKDFPDLLNRAKEEITVGKMQKLLEKNVPTPQRRGLIRRLLRKGQALNRKLDYRVGK